MDPKPPSKSSFSTTCARCGKEFTNKFYYEQHMARKNPCRPGTKAIKKREPPVAPPYVIEWAADIPSATKTPISIKSVAKRPEVVRVHVDFETMFQGWTIPSDATTVVDPFVNSPHKNTELSEFVSAFKKPARLVLDADPITNPPLYGNAWIIAKPPIGLRRTFEDQSVFDLYKASDLYKCFLASFLQQAPIRGGWIILPLSFFVVGEDLQRSVFLSKYLITAVNLWPNTSGREKPLVAIAFERSATVLTRQTIPFTQFPERKQQVFVLEAVHKWEFKPNVLPRSDVWFTRYVAGQTLPEGAQVLSLTIHTLDSEGSQGRIHIEYKPGYVYPGKVESRAVSTLIAHGRGFSDAEQIELATAFNLFLEAERERLWSLFLMAYDERNGHARHRLSFRLAFKILAHLTPERRMLEP
jgi:hypothetical protein